MNYGEQQTAELIKMIKELFRQEDRRRYCWDHPGPQIDAEREKLNKSIAHQRKLIKDKISNMENIQAMLRL